MYRRSADPPSQDLLQPKQFLTLFRSELRLAATPDELAAAPLTDFCDSLQMLEALVVMEELGAPVSADEVHTITTFNDLYRHYRAAHD